MKLQLTLSKILLTVITVCISQVAAADWTTCYNSQEHRLYFSPYKKLKAVYQSPKTCSSSTYYQADSIEDLIESQFDEKGYPIAGAGTPKIINVSDSKKLLISQWNSMGQINNLRVLAPDFDNKNVPALCDIPNWGEAYSVKVDPKGEKLMLLVRQPKNQQQDKFAMRWVACPL